MLTKNERMAKRKECGKPVSLTEESRGAFNPTVYWYVCEDGHETGCSTKRETCLSEIKDVA